MIAGTIKNHNENKRVPFFSLLHPSIASSDILAGNILKLFSKNIFRFFHAFISAATPMYINTIPDIIRIIGIESEI